MAFLISATLFASTADVLSMLDCILANWVAVAPRETLVPDCCGAVLARVLVPRAFPSLIFPAGSVLAVFSTFMIILSICRY